MSDPEAGQLWGILGGAFDPFHLGHLTLARETGKLRRFDGILVVPTFDPPHRLNPPEAAYLDRVEMARLALAGQVGLELSRIEETTPRPSFTLNSVRSLKTRYPGTEFELIIGADQLASFHRWHRWRELLAEVRVIVGLRPDAAAVLPPELPAERIVILETVLIDVSSTDIRAQIRAGVDPLNLCHLMPAEVAEFIKARKLYR